jgi:hypothetical protein
MAHATPAPDFDHTILKAQFLSLNLRKSSTIYDIPTTRILYFGAVSYRRRE